MADNKQVILNEVGDMGFGIFPVDETLVKTEDKKEKDNREE